MIMRREDQMKQDKYGLLVAHYLSWTSLLVLVHISWYNIYIAIDLILLETKISILVL